MNVEKIKSILLSRNTAMRWNEQCLVFVNVWVFGKWLKVWILGDWTKQVEIIYFLSFVNSCICFKSLEHQKRPKKKWEKFEEGLRLWLITVCSRNFSIEIYLVESLLSFVFHKMKIFLFFFDLSIDIKTCVYANPMRKKSKSRKRTLNIHNRIDFKFTHSI